MKKKAFIPAILVLAVVATSQIEIGEILTPASPLRGVLKIIPYSHMLLDSNKLAII